MTERNPKAGPRQMLDQGHRRAAATRAVVSDRRAILLAAGVFLMMAWSAIAAHAATISDFYGSYSGSAEVVSTDGEVHQRDMSVKISGYPQDKNRKDQFTVAWTSISYFDDGRSKEASYSIDFNRTDRPDVFAAAMQKNVFGHEVQADPMKGQPFVWARIQGNTMTVFSLFVGDDGGYEIQQYDRTLTDLGLDLAFSRVRNGEILRTINTILVRD
ncbi:hypothetical protein [Chachezhania sediminis]|uniref:hypothetical protein n=1 Tax=Chachezhania sediminis TaxID=2599291 RepID=UPI001E376E18|nr:hypothetical protein [Chachezhania sediminis]